MPAPGGKPVAFHFHYIDPKARVASLSSSSIIYIHAVAALRRLPVLVFLLISDFG